MTRTPLYLLGLLCLHATVSLAEDAESAAPESVAVHGQLTYTSQSVGSFTSTYSGANSLHPNQRRSTTDATLYAGARLAPGLEAWINVEVDQGFGLDNTLGMAGFPSGEAYKVGRQDPYLRLPRLFVRDTVNLDGESTAVASQANQLAGRQSAHRWVFTVGKFGVTDIFDDSQYAHDARHDFLNWTAIDAGTFDYAADAWGFSIGATAERYAGDWVARLGLFDLSSIPNSAHLTPGFHQFQWVGELEHHHQWQGHDGKVLVTAYESRAQMGRLSDAIAAASLDGSVPDVSTVRHRDQRLGISLLAEQALSADIGAFMRIGHSDGRFEAYEFTDIDRAIAVGLSSTGTRWQRPSDTLGLAVMRNDLSAVRAQYLALGGLGILIGDGALRRVAPESIVEAYYAFALGSWGALTLDLQRVDNPAYNAERGPLTIGSVRFHAQF
jgi:high affinity Mn2+ porin